MSEPTQAKLRLLGEGCLGPALFAEVERISDHKTWSYEAVAKLDETIGGVGLRAFDSDRLPEDSGPGHALWRPLWYCWLVLHDPLIKWAPRFLVQSTGLFLEGIAKRALLNHGVQANRLPLGQLARPLARFVDAETAQLVSAFSEFYNLAKHHVEATQSVFTSRDALVLFFVGRKTGCRLLAH